MIIVIITYMISAICFLTEFRLESFLIKIQQPSSKIILSTPALFFLYFYMNIKIIKTNNIVLKLYLVTFSKKFTIILN